MEHLIKNLTQKNEEIALKSAKEILDGALFEAFEKLSEKSDFLFDFIKVNVCKRFYTVADANNYKNVIKFFKLYDATYVETFINILLKFSSDDLDRQMLDLLQNGDENEKAYCAKYFEIKPNELANSSLYSCAFDDFEPLSENATLALAKIEDKKSIELAYEKLNSNDDFEVIKGIKFLTVYPELSQLDKIIEVALNCSMRENACADIANAVDLFDLVINKQNSNNLLLLNSIVIGLAEILPLYQIVDFKLFDVFRELININYEDGNSQISEVLLNMYSKIKLFYENDEYTYDEDVDTKNEIKKMLSLFQNQGEGFWNEQKDLIFDELEQSDKRIIAALNVIKELSLKNHVSKIVNLTTRSNEMIVCLAVEVLAQLEELDKISISEVAKNINDPNIQAIIQQYK